MLTVPCSAGAQSCQSEWSIVGSFNNAVYALAAFDDGSGPALYVGGGFTAVNGLLAMGIARWRGGVWSPVGSGLLGPAEVRALAVFDPDESGPRPPVLCAGGFFGTAGGAPAANIAAWDGTTWSPLAGGTNGGILSMTVFDNDGLGPRPAALYIGGLFTVVDGQPAPYIAAWNGTAWLQLGAGMSSWGWSVAGYMDDLPGPGLGSLYVGSFLRIARFDGASWVTVGGNIHGDEPRVFGLGVFDDDGSGPRRPGLYVSGTFDYVGTTPASGIARWDGLGWSTLGAGLQFGGDAGFARSLIIFDDSARPALFVGGMFNLAGGVPARNVARWDGSAWSALGPGIQTSVYSLAAFDTDGQGPNPPELFVGAGCPCNPSFSGQLVRWSCPPCYANCDGSTAAPVLDVSDFICFVNVYSAGDPHANCDGSTTPPVLNVNDFVCFNNRFAAGCP